MGSRKFSTFAEASAFAKRHARESKHPPQLIREGNAWVVESADSQDKPLTPITEPEKSPISPKKAKPRKVHPASVTTKPKAPAVVVKSKRVTSPDSGIFSQFKKEVSEIEHRTDISDTEKVSRITHIACATCAGIAIQPIPFADIFVLTPVQAYFASRIAAIRGVPISESEASDWVKEIIGIVGLGIIAQQVAIGIWKLVVPGLGSVLTIPLVYGLTYAIMGVADAYFFAKARGEKLTDARINAIWKGAFRKGKEKSPAENQRKK